MVILLTLRTGSPEVAANHMQSLKQATDIKA